MSKLSLLLLTLASVAGCGINPSGSGEEGRLESGAGAVLESEAGEQGPVAGTYAVTLESTLQMAAVDSVVDRLTDVATLRCFFSTSCVEVVDRIAKVDSAEELLDPHCDDWWAEHEGNVTTVTCLQVDRRAEVVVDGGGVFITLETEEGEVKETDAPLPSPGKPVMIHDLVDELGGVIELHFTPVGFVGAREATEDSSLVIDVRKVLDDAGLGVEILLDFAIRGAREGGGEPEVKHVLEYF